MKFASAPRLHHMLVLLVTAFTALCSARELEGGLVPMMPQDGSSSGSASGLSSLGFRRTLKHSAKLAWLTRCRKNNAYRECGPFRTVATLSPTLPHCHLARCCHLCHLHLST